MEQGVVFGRSLLGYDVKDGKMTVNPEGAEIVRQIFRKYGIEKKAPPSSPGSCGRQDTSH